MLFYAFLPSHIPRSFLHGMPAGHDVSRFRSGIFFFFIVVTNVHINLCIKLCPPLVRIYCFDCLKQKRPNQTPLSARISRGRGPTHLYLCDVKANHHLEKLFSFNGGHMSEFTTPDLPFSERKQTFYER